MKQKKSYKSVPAAAVVKEYRLAIIGIWILHILTVPAAAFLIWRGISGQTILVNGIFEAIVALFANYLIRVLKNPQAESGQPHPHLRLRPRQVRGHLPPHPGRRLESADLHPEHCPCPLLSGKLGGRKKGA